MPPTAVVIEPRQPQPLAARRWLALADAEQERELAAALAQATGCAWQVIRDGERVIIQSQSYAPPAIRGESFDTASRALVLSHEGTRLTIESLRAEEIDPLAGAAAALADWLGWSEPIVNSRDARFTERFTHCALHGRDFHRWALITAQALRERRPEGIHWPRLAEEIERLGQREARLWFAHLARLLLHLLKWHYQPNRRCREWLVAMHDDRLEMAELCERSPSLGAHLGARLDAAYRRARHAASVDTGLAETGLPIQCPWSAEQISDPDFPSAASDRAR